MPLERIRADHLPGRVWVLTSAVTIVGAQALVPGTLLKDVGQSFSLPAGTVGALFGGYGLALAVTSLAAAAILGGIPARTRLVAGLTGLAVALAVIAAASASAVLLTGIVLAGIAGGVLLPAVYAMVPGLVPRAGVGQAMSRTLLGWALSFIVGIPIAALVSQWSSWRAAFVFLSVTALLTAAAALTLPPVVTVAPEVAGFGRVLRDRRTVMLFIGIALFMAAFYGVFAVEGTAARDVQRAGSWLPASIALAYGQGFSITTGLHRLVERAGRFVLPGAFLVLAGVFWALPWGNEHLVAVLVLAVIWGLVNESVLTVFLTRLTTQRESAAALALYNTVTYLSAALGTVVAGTALTTVGFPAVSAMATGSSVLGVIAVTLGRPGRERVGATKGLEA